MVVQTKHGSATHRPGDRDHDLPLKQRCARKGADDGRAESPRTTKLYDRTSDAVSLDEVERVVVLTGWGQSPATTTVENFRLGKVMVDVFISYARQDRKIATKLARALEDQGYSVWWDPVIPPGKTWAEVIGTQLAAASCVVTLWSAVSVTKRWVRKEATFADDRNKLIPAKLEDVAIPFAFADVQAADLTGWGETPATRDSNI